MNILSLAVSIVKKKHGLIYFIHLNGIDKKTRTDTHKPVQQPIQKSTSSYDCSRELCDSPIRREHKPYISRGDQALSLISEGYRKGS